MDYVARLVVPSSQTTWPAEEVPQLTANALCPVPDSPPLYVTELLRIDEVNGRSAQTHLADTDRKALDRHWLHCGLPPIDRPMTTDEWVPYLIAFNEAPARPAWADWVFAVMPPDDPTFYEGVLRDACMEEHRKRLRHAVDTGEVVARLPGVMTEAPRYMNLQYVVLTRSELVKFCALLAIGVVDIPATAPADCEPVPATKEATPPDYSALATRKQLIAAFGAFTGMSMKWFVNLTDKPALLKARKVDGVGARGSTREPLFCPWEVMVWLASAKRKTGREFHGLDKPWELLENHFPAAYAKHSRHDPRE